MQHVTYTFSENDASMGLDKNEWLGEDCRWLDEVQIYPELVFLIKEPQ